MTADRSPDSRPTPPLDSEAAERGARDHVDLSRHDAARLNAVAGAFDVDDWLPLSVRYAAAARALDALDRLSAAASPADRAATESVHNDGMNMRDQLRAATDAVQRGYSAALDEVYRLRTLMAVHASVLSTQVLTYSTLPKGAAAALDAIRGDALDAARGEAAAVLAGAHSARASRSRDWAQIPHTLTRWAWEAALAPVPPTADTERPT